jgi:hypothetical protein
VEVAVGLSDPASRRRAVFFDAKIAKSAKNAKRAATKPDLWPQKLFRASSRRKAH